MRCGTLILTLTCFSLLLATGTAEAAIIVDDGFGTTLRDSGAGFFQNPVTDIDFSESDFPDGSFDDETVDGTRFQGISGSSLSILLPSGESLLYTTVLETVGTVQVDLPVPVNRVGFDYELRYAEYDVEGQDDPVVHNSLWITAFSGSGPHFFQHQFVGGLVPGESVTGFIGLQSTTDITSITINNGGGAFYIDNMRAETGVIPEPGSLAIWSVLGLSLIAFGWRRRK